MGGGSIGYSYVFDPEGGQLPLLVAQVGVWLVVTIACLVAVRRSWAWPGLLGGVLGLATSAVVLADAIQARSDVQGAVAEFGPPADEPVVLDLPGFILDNDIGGLLSWAETVAIGLVGIALLVGAVLSRRARRD